MRIHHLNCGSFCPTGRRAINGTGGWLETSFLSCHCLLVETGDGLVLGAGRIALDYAEAGGEVLMIGKPAREMFDLALDRLGRPDPGRTLMIGDSLHHDIAGAKPLGLATLLVTSGLLAGEADRLSAACAEAGVEPDYVAESLVW